MDDQGVKSENEQGMEEELQLEARVGESHQLGEVKMEEEITPELKMEEPRTPRKSSSVSKSDVLFPTIASQRTRRHSKQKFSTVQFFEDSLDSQEQIQMEIEKIESVHRQQSRAQDLPAEDQHSGERAHLRA